MRAFILRLTYFAAPLLIVACVGDFILSRTLKKSKTISSGEYCTWNDVYEGKVNSDVVVYGSSRAVVHFDPTIIEDSLHLSCYNLGTDGNNFWLQYFRHGEFLKHNKKPEAIIFSLDATTLTAKGNIFNSTQFLPYMLFDESIRKYTTSYNYYSAWDYRVPLVRFFGNERVIMHALKLLFFDQPDSLGRVKGYRGEHLSWNTDLLEARKMMTSYNVEIDNDALAVFESFLVECQNLGIRIIFVYSPQYIEGQKFVQNKDQILDIYRSLSMKYKIPYLDYSTDSICYSKTYFYNSSHLNKEGSKIFSRKLGHDLKHLLN